MRALSLVAMLVGCVASCSTGLDSVKEIKDLRLIGMRAEPPEVLLNGPMPFDVQFDALVLDPRGGEVSYRWSFCPLTTENACLDYDSKRDASETRLLEAAEQSGGMFDSNAVTAIMALIDGMRATELSGTAVPLVEVQTPEPLYWWSERGIWPYSVPTFTFNAPGALYLFHLFDSGLGGGLGAWPSAILELSKGSETILAQKRMVLGIQDIGPFAEQVAAQFGATICPAGETPDTLPGCILLKPRVANSNPVFERVQFAYGDSAIAEFHDIAMSWDGDVSGTLHIPVGESVRLLPQFTDASSEEFQALRLDIDARKIEVQDRVEEISVSWFATYGEVQDQLTWPKFTKTLDTVYEAPEEVPEAGRDTVWMVARDQRGGTAWISVEFVIIP